VEKRKAGFDRPLKVDRDSYDKLTSARMTDHNVRGVGDEPKQEPERPLKDVPDEASKPAEAGRKSR